MAEQLSFPLPVKPALGRENFFVSEANQMAVALLENWADWPQAKMNLCGPEGSGKTHLAHVWASEAGAQIVAAKMLGGLDLPTAARSAYVVEDVDLIAGGRDAETLLFHFHNLMQAEGQPLLLTSASAPSALGWALPDLASRLQATAVATIEPPDEMLLSVILMKQFSERQINIPAGLLDYIIPRLPRSFAAAHKLVDELDRRALAENRPIGPRLAREVLETNLDSDTENPA